MSGARGDLTYFGKCSALLYIRTFCKQHLIAAMRCFAVSSVIDIGYYIYGSVQHNINIKWIRITRY